MGYIRKSGKYKLEIDGHIQAWRTVDGRPTKKNLAKYIYAYGKSLESGGINHHISKQLGYIPYPNYARIALNEPTGQGDFTIVEWKAHIFQGW